MLSLRLMPAHTNSPRTKLFLPGAESTPTFQRIAKLRQRAAESKPSRGPARERSDRGLLSRIPPTNSRRGGPSDRARQTRQGPLQDPSTRPPWHSNSCSQFYCAPEPCIPLSPRNRSAEHDIAYVEDSCRRARRPRHPTSQRDIGNRFRRFADPDQSSTALFDIGKTGGYHGEIGLLQRLL